MTTRLRSSTRAIAIAPTSQSELVDRFGRVISYLRASLTPVCNLRCSYCVPPGPRHRPTRAELLSNDEVVEVISAAASLGIASIRLTGGEPLLRSGIVTLIRRVADVQGIEDVSMTTNGILLQGCAHLLADAGLCRINVSLDTMDPAAYRSIAGRSALHLVLRGIDAALAAGLHPVKINAVVGASTAWQQDVLELVRFAIEQPVFMRFIERMPSGSFRRTEHVPVADVLNTIAEQWDLSPTPAPNGSGPAEYFCVNGGSGVIGTVAAVSKPFCPRCNRLRLTAAGHLQPCLFGEAAVDLRPVLQKSDPDRLIRLRGAFQAAALAKPPARQRFEDATYPIPSLAEVGG